MTPENLECLVVATDVTCDPDDDRFPLNSASDTTRAMNQEQRNNERLKLTSNGFGNSHPAETEMHTARGGQNPGSGIQARWNWEHRALNPTTNGFRNSHPRINRGVNRAGGKTTHLGLSTLSNVVRSGIIAESTLQATKQGRSGTAKAATR